MLQPEERIQFLSLARLNISPIPTREKDALLPLLLASSSNTTASDQFYRVPFERVPDLVSRREVYLRAGDAYVPHTHLISIILGDFKRNLMGYLEILAKMVPRMDEDDRLKPVLVNMSKVYGGKRFGEKGEGVTGKVSADDVDEVIWAKMLNVSGLIYFINSWWNTFRHVWRTCNISSTRITT